ncbi:peptidoglycan-binding domain-containing protein [Streptomyces omiyaensis]|uniref:Peptidoglycan-binding protein n=1 Tax=Streptomyces omiyaensis TaxID=68247 RepID=A0ABW7BZZ3_9ACTN
MHHSVLDTVLDRVDLRTQQQSHRRLLRRRGRRRDPRALASIRGLCAQANLPAGRTPTRARHGGLPGNSTSCPGAQLRAWVRAGMPADAVTIEYGTGGVYDGPSGDSSGGGGGGMTRVRPVAAQQRAVDELGHSPAPAVDGLWGPLTDAGVRRLRGRVGTAADGQWGPATVRAPQNALNPNTF